MVRYFPTDIEISRLSLHEFFGQSLRIDSHRTALVDDDNDRSYTYGELDESIRRVSSGLHRLGVAKGDIVIVYCPNCIEYVYAVFAIVSNGAIAALVNPSHTAYELEHALNLTKPTWIITVPSLIGKVQEATKNLPTKIKATIVIREHLNKSSDVENQRVVGSFVPFEMLLSDDGSWYPSSVPIDSAKDVAFILFSSGTTGPPKGVMLSHYNLVATLVINDYANRKGIAIQEPGEQLVMIAFLPMCHAAGLLLAVVRGLLSKQKLIILKRFELERVLQCTAKYKVTFIPLVPSVFLLLSKSPFAGKSLSTVRRFRVGGAPLSASTCEEFSRMSGCSDICQGYGLTEVTLSCISNEPLTKRKPGSVGVTLPNTEAVVVDSDSGRVLGANQKGEICVRGPQVMMGYINNLEATRATIDKDGWLHTGDIGYYDDDGHFFIVDRLKELIKYKGFQVAPAELESLILTNPEVADVAVMGVDDREAGELPRAFVVRKPGSRLSAEDIKQMVEERVSSFKFLRGGVEFVDKIPKSESGKILRRLLRQKYSHVQTSKL